jgi:tight adherence protein C
MSASQLIFLLVVFGVVVGLAGACMLFLSPRPVRERLDTFTGNSAPSQLENGGWVERVAKVAQPFTRLSLPEEGWEKSTLRIRFMNAGWRTSSAPTLYFASKTLLALGVPGALSLVLMMSARMPDGEALLMLLFGCAAIGYYIPNMVLGQLVRRRQREIFETVPDALDLLTVCVEAGLSLERALIKVAAEIHIKSLVLAQELQLVLMEMRAGFTKEKALRNFALRTGVEDVDTLVAMLIQSERFGTSMGAALRVHSDNLRTRRRLMAEEKAARIALKLMFPLIFCIFPTVLMVLIGPAMIQIVRTVMPAMGSH